MKFELETERLILRELVVNDAEAFYRLNENPNVLRFTGDESFSNVEDAVEFLKNYNPYSTFKMGRWAVISKADDSFLGWCGLKIGPENNEVDLGFRFFENEWGKGYATEASKVCLKYGFEVLNLSNIVGRVMKNKIGSIRVLEKLDFKYDEILDRNNSNDWRQYVLTKEQYLRCQESI